MPTLKLPADLFESAMDAYEVGAEGAPLDEGTVADTTARLEAARDACEGSAEVSVELEPEQLECFEDCFVVGAEGDDDVPEADFRAVLDAVAAAKGAAPAP